MRNSATSILVPAIMSLVLVLPFIGLEWINRRNLPEEFPVMLFGLLWIGAAVFVLLLMPIVRNLLANNKIKLSFLNLLLRVAFLVLTAWFWIGLILDQWPCFLCVQNCD